jgi:hypothetical protein
LRRLRVRLDSVTVAVPLRQLMDVPGDDAALRAPDLAIVCWLADLRPTGFVHVCSSSRWKSCMTVVVH